MTTLMDSIGPPTAPADPPDPTTGQCVVTLRHTGSEHQRAKEAAWHRRLSLNEFVRRAVREAADMALEARAEELKRAAERNGAANGTAPK